jgi:CRP/FNR family transcriptional regulator, cyclic AMP receptor protein
MATDLQIIDALGATDLFSSLSKRHLRQVADSVHVVHHEAGKQITSEGNEGVGFHLILDGQATVRVHGGQPKSLTAGDYFGEISLIDGKPRSATVSADTDLTTASLVSWEFHRLALKEPTILDGLLHGMCTRIRATEDVRFAAAEA